MTTDEVTYQMCIVAGEVTFFMCVEQSQIHINGRFIYVELGSIINAAIQYQKKKMTFTAFVRGNSIVNCIRRW